MKLFLALLKKESILFEQCKQLVSIMNLTVVRQKGGHSLEIWEQFYSN